MCIFFCFFKKLKQIKTKEKANKIFIYFIIIYCLLLFIIKTVRYMADLILSHLMPIRLYS